MDEIAKSEINDLGVMAGGSPPTMREIELAREIVSTELGVKVGGSTLPGHESESAREIILCQMFGTADKRLAEDLLSQCLKPLRADEASDENPAHDERAFTTSMVRDLAPRDPVERMLAVQMAATHVATIRAGRWLANVENLPQAQAHYSGFNKLARTFAAQVEALRKHRTSGEQKVTVQHVNVSDGGQAIVGDVKTGGDGRR